MELVKLEEKEFKEFAYKHEQASFLQTIGWAKLKHDTGWDYELLGFKDNDIVIAGCMMLSKSTPIKKKMFYAPHGFILDYSDFTLLDNFVSEIKKYVKKNNGIFFKIDPYVMMVERDIDGNVVGVLVNPITGEVATDDSSKKEIFYYQKGTEPTLDGTIKDLDAVFKEENTTE